MEELTNDNMNYIASGKYITKMHLLDGFCSLDNIAEDKEGNPLLHRLTIHTLTCFSGKPIM